VLRNTQIKLREEMIRGIEIEGDCEEKMIDSILTSTGKSEVVETSWTLDQANQESKREK
jgi:hypothetical protein